jgi:transporter family protein
LNYVIFALLAAFFFGLAPIFGKLGLDGVNPVLALCIRSFVMTGIMLVWLLINTDINPITNVSPKAWGLIALEGICAALVGQLFYYIALKSGDPSIVVPLIATFPLFTFIIATIFLGDKITITKVGGLAFILMGIFMIRI